MILVSTPSYSDFKAVFMGLGGSRRTPVVYNDLTPLGATFNAIASFGQEQIALQLEGQAQRPAAFDSDFPQAVQTSGSVVTGA